LIWIYCINKGVTKCITSQKVKAQIEYLNIPNYCLSKPEINPIFLEMSVSKFQPESVSGVPCCRAVCCEKKLHFSKLQIRCLPAGKGRVELCNGRATHRSRLKEPAPAFFGEQASFYGGISGKQHSVKSSFFDKILLC
jgi:hypothetical protein